MRNFWKDEILKSKNHPLHSSFLTMGKNNFDILDSRTDKKLEIGTNVSIANLKTDIKNIKYTKYFSTIWNVKKKI